MSVFPRSLYGRLAASLFVLFAALALGMVAITHYFSERYQQEASQKLSSDLARHIVAERLLIRDGRADGAALKQIFERLMLINPSIELYLLDPRGKLLAYSAPPGKIKRAQIDMAPVHDFLSGRVHLPILGDDPRDARVRKIFSVAQIEGSQGLQGYLYIILAGERFTSISQRLQTSYVMRESVWTVGIAMVAAFIAGLAALFGLTRRLRRLSSEVERFERDGFHDGDISVAPAADEITQLALCFRQMAARIELQMRALKQADRLRRERVAQLSHDLRTSLTSLHGYLETLQIKSEQLGSDEKKRFLETAIKHSRRLARLVSDFFELAKLEYRDAMLERECISIGELAQDVVNKFQPLACARGIRLLVEADFHANWVNVDAGMMERVLTNLVDNALRFTAADGRVVVSLEAAGGEVCVAVSDTGCGIAPEDLSHLYDRSYWAARQHPNSAGLGLAIAKQIIELHDSELHVDSSVGVGTRFYFSMRRAQVPAAAVTEM